MNQTDPILFFDGNCRFCAYWAGWLRKASRNRVLTYPAESDTGRALGVPLEISRKSVQLFLPDGERRQGAFAVFTAMNLGGSGWGLACYQKIPGFKGLSEGVYRLVASHRGFFSKIFFR